jgi:2-hydroxychromene-2-carboxylate isomerase
MSDAQLHYYFDPVCPFAWMTSKWVRKVVRQRGYGVEWHFISLRLINANVDYASHFPPEYEDQHTAGLRLLRVAARTRSEHGQDAVGRLYEAFGQRIFEVPLGDDQQMPGARRGTVEFASEALRDAGLPESIAPAVDDDSWDAEIRQETDRALSLTGKDVGTPILHFEPPDGIAFFGPVISRLPSDEEAVQLWDHVLGLAAFPGFAELKRSLRELPQLPALGVAEDEVGKQEDWHAGSRRQKK